MHTVIKGHGLCILKYHCTVRMGIFFFLYSWYVSSIDQPKALKQHLNWTTKDIRFTMHHGINQTLMLNNKIETDLTGAIFITIRAIMLSYS